MSPLVPFWLSRLTFNGVLSPYLLSSEQRTAPGRRVTCPASRMWIWMSLRWLSRLKPFWSPMTTLQNAYQHAGGAVEPVAMRLPNTFGFGSSSAPLRATSAVSAGISLKRSTRRLRLCGSPVVISVPSEARSFVRRLRAGLNSFVPQSMPAASRPTALLGPRTWSKYAHLLRVGDRSCGIAHGGHFVQPYGIHLLTDRALASSGRR